MWKGVIIRPKLETRDFLNTYKLVPQYVMEGKGAFWELLTSSFVTIAHI